MNKDHALYFLEGLIAGMATPRPELVKRLFNLLAAEYDLQPNEFGLIREEIDGYLDEAESEEDRVRRAARG